MSNVPVLEAVRAAFAFRRRHWRTLAPVLGAVAVGAALNTAGDLTGQRALSGPGSLIYLVAGCMAYAALLRAAFADERPDDPELVPGQGGFQWGKPEWRLLGVAGLLALINLLALSLFIFVGVVAVMVLMSAGLIQPLQPGAGQAEVLAAMSPQSRTILTALIFGAVAALVYMMMRISLAPAATISRGRVAVFQTWALTKGQGWRILAATVLSSAPSIAMTLLLAALVSLLGQPGAPGQPPIMPLVAALPAAAAFAVVIAFVQMPVSVGLTAFLYRGLRPAGER